MATSKQDFVSILYRLTDEAKGFRRLAFQKAITALEEYDEDDLYLSEAKKLPGFGAGMIKRLKEYIDTGTLKELEGTEGKHEALTLFQGIYGVGPITANKMYRAGYRTLEDIPLNTLSRQQQLGVKYYYDINSRIPRKEIREFEKQLLKRIDNFNSENKSEFKVQICGSYLRGKNDSGDIDTIVSERNNRFDLMEDLLLALYPLIEFILSKGTNKILTLGGIGKKMRRIDLEIVKWENYPFALLYFTGSKNFNKCVRQIAKDKGYTLNQEGLFGEGISYSFETEREIFDFLRIKYQTPEERDLF